MSSYYFAFLLLCVRAVVSYGQQDKASDYSNWWAVQILGSMQEATDTAEENGFANLGKIGNLEGFYHFVSVDDQFSGLENALQEVDMQDQLTARLKNHTKVMYAEQQRFKVMESYTMPYYSSPTDPGWQKQWSLLNGNDDYKRDINVEPVWMQGINGSGITVAIVDNGVDMNHDDLAPNFNMSASWDFGHNDSDPSPDDPTSEVAYHGTSCAGEVAMVKDNAVCGVGVAYASQIAALKFNASALTDIDNAKMWSYMDDYIDIYSNSFGPSDAGYVVEGPGHILNLTLATAVQKGRNRKGSIFVMASGNGGLNNDSCAANGYASSIYTISVGSADQASYQAIYDEQCASKMVVTFSFNSSSFHEGHNQMYTTVLNGKCNDSFTGTSASAPLVSATIALCLHANPNLTWRDIQYLLAYTSDPHILEDGEFQENGGSLMVSHKFGFGALDAEAMVTRAKRWINVPDQLSYSTGRRWFGSVYPGQPYSDTVDISPPLSYLEHVMVTATVVVDGYNMSYSLNDYITLKNTTHLTVEEERAWLASPHPRRGDIKIELTSPSGTKSVLLPFRDLDFINTEGYQNWPFTSVQHWGENPVGMWTLDVTYRSSTGYATIEGASLTLYGTREIPQAVQNIPSDCDIACKRYCSGIGPDNCDACLIKRVSETLECVENCPNGTQLYKSHYCNPLETPSDIVTSTSDMVTSTGNAGENTDLPFHKMLVIIIGSIAGGVTLFSIIVILICACCISWCKRKKRPTYVRLQFEEIPPTPV